MRFETEATLRILLYSSSLVIGGAEAHAVRLANALSRDFQHEIVLAVARDGNPLKRRLGPGVSLVEFGASRPEGSVRQLRRTLRRFDPEVMISLQDNANVSAVVAHKLAKSRATLILSVQNLVAQRKRGATTWRQGILPLAIRATYPFADGVVAISRDIEAELAVLCRRLRHVTVLGNACLDGGAQEQQDSVLAREYSYDPSAIVACGRLVEQKGYDRLLRIVARIAQTDPQVKLLVVGDGPLRLTLWERSRELGLEEHVRFLGATEDPGEVIGRSCALALASYWEGFGNVLIEAMGQGVPVVSFSCPGGPRDIIRSGENGFLIDEGDEEGFARALVGLMRDSETRLAMSREARETSREYESSRVAARYLEFAGVPVRGG